MDSRPVQRNRGGPKRFQPNRFQQNQRRLQEEAAAAANTKRQPRKQQQKRQFQQFQRNDQRVCILHFLLLRTHMQNWLMCSFHLDRAGPKGQLCSCPQHPPSKYVCARCNWLDYSTTCDLWTFVGVPVPRVMFQAGWSWSPFCSN